MDLILNVTSTIVEARIPDVIREMYRYIMCVFKFKSWIQIDQIHVFRLDVIMQTKRHMKDFRWKQLFPMSIGSWATYYKDFEILLSE